MKFKDIEDYRKNTLNVVVSEEKIREAVKKAGQSLNEIYDGTPLLLVSVLKGAFVFLADLCREITVPCEIGFMAAKSYYEGTSSTGEVTVTMDLQQDISNYHVVIVEDIIDSGRTLKSIAEILRGRNPVSLCVITLLDKPERREVDFKADISLFTIPDLFVVGYGLDYAEYYRNLPYVASVES